MFSCDNVKVSVLTLGEKNQFWRDKKKLKNLSLKTFVPIKRIIIKKGVVAVLFEYIKTLF